MKLKIKIFLQISFFVGLIQGCEKSSEINSCLTNARIDGDYNVYSYDYDFIIAKNVEHVGLPINIDCNGEAEFILTPLFLGRSAYGGPVYRRAMSIKTNAKLSYLYTTEHTTLVYNNSTDTIYERDDSGEYIAEYNDIESCKPIGEGDTISGSKTAHYFPILQSRDDIVEGEWTQGEYQVLTYKDKVSITSFLDGELDTTRIYNKIFDNSCFSYGEGEKIYVRFRTNVGGLMREGYIKMDSPSHLIEIGIKR